MIHYQLQCSAAHGFDGWFRDSAAYESQAKQGLLECPVCGERQVARALMAPALPRKGRKKRQEIPEVTPEKVPDKAVTPQPEQTPSQMPAQMRAMLQKLRAEVEKRCEDVGDDFAAEARRIHEGESRPRGIYGEATEEQTEALREDGIEVGRIPWLPRSDA